MFENQRKLTFIIFVFAKKIMFFLQKNKAIAKDKA
jgi:hypothetical protein